MAKMRRLKSMYSSDQIEQVQAFRAEVDQAMESVRVEYAKHGEQA
jgi:V/A-type H+/Na+-transporting ATPase subunit A